MEWIWNFSCGFLVGQCYEFILSDVKLQHDMKTMAELFAGGCFSFMNGNMMLDLFCPHLMNDEALIQLPGKSSRFEIHRNLELEKKGSRTIALEAVANLFKC